MALAPLVRALSRVMPRWLAAAIVVLGLAGSFGIGAWVLSDDVAAFSRRLPGIVRDIRLAVQSASPRQSLLNQLQQAVSELEKTATPAKTGRRDAGHDRRIGRRAAAGDERRAQRRQLLRDRHPADVPGLFPAVRRRDVQAETRQAEWRAAVAEESHGADDRRDHRAGGAVRVLPVLERPARRRRDLAVLPVDRRALRRPLGRRGRRPELHSVLRPDDHHGGRVGRRAAAVQVGVDGRASSRSRRWRSRRSRGSCSRRSRSAARPASTRCRSSWRSCSGAGCGGRSV